MSAIKWSDLGKLAVPHYFGSPIGCKRGHGVARRGRSASDGTFTRLGMKTLFIYLENTTFKRKNRVQRSEDLLLENTTFGHDFSDRPWRQIPKLRQ